ncbi:PAS domain-containing protein [Geminocystis sp. CENA526]|uniref:PAS domain-containing protein n=1 Tax=Geminocystis sp. CENA526 TaxID=1355871 RepID=UPI003D6EE995
MTVILLIIIIINFALEIRALDDSIIEKAIESSRLISESMINARDIYSTEVVAKLNDIPEVNFSHNYSSFPNHAPIPASFLMELSEKIRQSNPELIVRYYSDYPFPWREKEGGVKDDFQKSALQNIRQNPSQPFYREEKIKGVPFFRYGVGDVMKPSCVECHNRHPDSPKRDWKVGDVRGVLEISYPLSLFQSADNYTHHLTRLVVITFVVIILLYQTIEKMVKSESNKKINQILQEANRELEEKVEMKTKDLILKERAIAATQNGIIIVDATKPDFPCMLVNPAFEQMTGYQAKEVIGKNCRFLQGNDQNQESLQILRRSLKNHQGCQVIVRNYKKNGDLFWNELNISPIYDVHGNLTHYIGVQNDVTERVNTEQIMKRQLNAMDATIDGIAVLENEIFVYVNASHHKLFGYNDPQDLIGVNWRVLYSPQEVDRIEKDIFPILYDHGYWQGEAIATKKDGSTFIEGLSLSINDNVIICICRDITDIKKAQEEVKTSLRQKEILLKEIHHRVKNNLLVVSSLIDWQTEFLTDPNIISIMEDSQKRIQSMALIHEKLYKSSDLARIDLAEYLKSLIEQVFLSSNLNLDKINIEFDLQSIFVNIETATPCGLIVNELVANSLEHAFSNQENGTISLNLCLDRSKKITLIVKDNGIGFPDNFDWQKTDSLGLQLVSLLTQQLEGKLVINQEQGTEVIIAFKELEYNTRF